MREVADKFPEILRWVITSYSSASKLIFNGKIIPSVSGFHQGDPLASLLFALVLHPLILKLLELVPTLAFNGWFHDDGSQVGTKEELQQVIDLLVEEGPRLGLHLSTSLTSANPKSQVWSPLFQTGSDDPLDRGIPKVRDLGVTFLGAPIGNPAFTRGFIAAKVEKIKEVAALLPNIKKPHLEFVLLRSCIAIPKIMFTLRTTRASDFPDLLQSFDSVIREALIKILGTPLENKQWLQAKLAVGRGGLGIRGAEDHAGAAFASSFLSSQPLVKELLGQDDDATPSLPRDLIESLTTKLGEEDRATVLQGIGGEEATTTWLQGLSQKKMSSMIDEENSTFLKRQVEAEGDVREIARIASLGLPYAGAWLEAVPIPALGLYLQPSEFVLSVRYRLGCQVYDRAGPCPACHRHSDAFGDHAMCCGHQGERISRHNALRDAIHDTAAAAALNPIKEGRYLLPGNNRRPADVYIAGWEAGKDAALDITVVNPLQEALVQEAAATPGHALQFRHNTKMAGAAAECQAQGIAFLPLVVESLGGWDERAVHQVKKLSSALARNSGEDEGDTWRKTITRLSILLVKGNAALLSGRIPSSPSEFHEAGIV